jgi:hypothetical protein
MRLIAEPSKKGVEQKLDIKFLAAPIKIKCSNKVEDIVFALNWAKIAKLLPAAIFFQLRPD